MPYIEFNRDENVDFVERKSNVVLVSLLFIYLQQNELNVPQSSAVFARLLHMFETVWGIICNFCTSYRSQ